MSGMGWRKCLIAAFTFRGFDAISISVLLRHALLSEEDGNDEFKMCFCVLLAYFLSVGLSHSDRLTIN